MSQTCCRARLYIICRVLVSEIAQLFFFRLLLLFFFPESAGRARTRGSDVTPEAADATNPLHPGIAAASARHAAVALTASAAARYSWRAICSEQVEAFGSCADAVRILDYRAAVCSGQQRARAGKRQSAVRNAFGNTLRCVPSIACNSTDKSLYLNDVCDR